MTATQNNEIEGQVHRAAKYTQGWGSKCGGPCRYREGKGEKSDTAIGGRNYEMTHIAVESGFGRDSRCMENIGGGPQDGLRAGGHGRITGQPRCCVIEGQEEIEVLDRSS